VPRCYIASEACTGRVEQMTVILRLADSWKRIEMHFVEFCLWRNNCRYVDAISKELQDLRTIRNDCRDQGYNGMNSGERSDFRYENKHSPERK
jgi:hypothetical protein